MIKETVTRITRIVFPNFTVDGVALFLHQLVFNSWSALGNVATNVLLQFLAGAAISKAELVRSAISQLLPVIVALLWPSPMQRFHNQPQAVVSEQTTTTTTSDKPYIAPRSLTDDEPKAPKS